MSSFYLWLAVAAVWDAGLLWLACGTFKRSSIRAHLVTSRNLMALALCAAGQSALASYAPSVAAAIVTVMLLGCACISALTDLAAGFVLDVITLPSLGFSFAIAIAAGSPANMLAGTACVGGAFLLLYAISRGRGIGFGDVKLACCIGALLGPIQGLIAVAVAFVLGGTYASILLLMGRAQRSQSMPFAPYLAAGVFADFVHRLT